MDLTITFCTRYNGVYISVDDDDIEVTKEMEDVMDKVSDTLPSMTYEMVDKFDCELSESDINKLIDKSKEIIKDVIPVSNISFEYDEYSS